MKKQTVSFIQEGIIATISTCDGLIAHGAPIFYIFIEEENAFYFLTNTQTEKHANIEKNNNAAISIYTETPPIVFNANCVAEICDFKSGEYSEHVSRLVAMHSSQAFYPTPVSTFKDGEISLIKLNVECSDLKQYKKDIDSLSAYF